MVNNDRKSNRKSNRLFSINNNDCILNYNDNIINSINKNIIFKWGDMLIMQIFDIVEELEKERKKNIELQELCDKYEEEHKTTFEIWQKDIKENKKLKQKIEYLKNNEYLNQVKWERDLNENIVTDLTNIIDKAINYIEKYCVDGVENEYNTPQTVFEEDGIEKDNARIELLNILKGR